MADYRASRVGRLIQEKIGALIVEGKIKDPRIDSFLSITRVQISRDLVYATVYVSSFKSPAGLAKGVKGLQNAAGFIQGQLAKDMHIRQTPKLRFLADAGVREGFELIQKIDGLIEELSEHDTP